MLFNNWKTHYELTTEQIGKDVSIEEYVRAYINYTNGSNAEPIYFKEMIDDCLLFTGEVEWLTNDRPYYNIYPNIIDSTMRMKLSKIPCSMLDTPGGYKSILIRFPQENDVGIRAVFAYKEPKVMLTLFTSCTPIKPGVERILLVNKINLRDENSIEHAIEETICENITPGVIDHHSMKYDPKEISKQSIRFYALTNFLSNYPNDLLIEYDVMHKFRNQFSLASPEKKQEMIRISRKHHKVGWNIGVNEHLLGDIPRCSEERNAAEYLDSEERKELTNAHIRTGHIHIVRFGPEKKQAKVMWFRPTVVRPDLPFKSNGD